MRTTASNSRAREVAVRPGACAPARTAHPRRIRARPLPPRSAAQAHRAAVRGIAQPIELAARVRRRAAPRIRPAHRGSAGTGGPSARRRRSGWRGRRAAGTSRSSAATPSWQTSSTSPMSMPSSSDAVATSALQRPCLEPLLGVEALSPSRGCRDARRRSLRRGARSRWRVTRSTMRRVFANTSVVWCSRMSVASGRRPSAQTSPDITASSGASGSTSARSRSRTWPLSTMTGAGSRRFAADRGAGAGIRPHQEIRDLFDGLLRGGQARCAAAADACRAASRSSDSARCEPRLVPATAWISSTMTVRAVAEHLAARLAGQQQIQRLGRRHQDMRRTLAHGHALGLRRIAGAHLGADLEGAAARALSAPAAIPASGSSRLRWMSLDSAFSGDT